MNYSDRKFGGVCCRSGCPRQAMDDHLLCLECAEDHCERQARSKRQRYWAKKLQVPLPLLSTQDE